MQEIISVPFGFRTVARAAYKRGAFHSIAAAEAFLRLSTPTLFSRARHGVMEAARTEAEDMWRRAVWNICAPKLKTGFFPQGGTLVAAEEDQAFFEKAWHASAENTPLALRLETFEDRCEHARAAPPDAFLTGEAAFVSLYEEGRNVR